MEKIIKIVAFIVLTGFMFYSLLVGIPEKFLNIIYGAMAIFALFFVAINRDKMGLNSMFDKKKKSEEPSSNE